MESSLREHLERLRVLFDEAPVAMLVHDKDTGEVVDANIPAINAYGYEDLADLKAHFAWASAPYSFDRALAWIRRACEEGPQQFEWLTEKKTGETFWEEVRLRKVRIDGVDRVLAMCSDITRRKQAEAEREQLQAQLLHAHKMESVGRLAGGIAHDFNNMLQIIIGHVEMALTDISAGHPIYDDLQEIKRSARRSAELTRQLLAFARKQTASPKVMDLNESVTANLAMLRRLIGEEITLLWKPARELLPVLIDPQQMDQVLTSLLVNARDAIAGIGEITISTANPTLDAAAARQIDAQAAPGEYVLLRVCDTGCGMDKETIKHVFEPFFTTKEVGKGSGMGLSTVYGIVRQNDGYITVESEPGQGTAVHIYLPCVHAQMVSEETADNVAAPPGTETVLLVEDEPSIAKLGEACLKRNGYNVLVACTPGEALRLARSYDGPIHLLLTDVVMPEMNGKALRDEIMKIHRNIKTLFMSGYTAEMTGEHGVLEEDVILLRKPFSIHALTAQVRNVLDNR